MSKLAVHTLLTALFLMNASGEEVGTASFANGGELRLVYEVETQDGSAYPEQRMNLYIASESGEETVVETSLAHAAIRGSNQPYNECTIVAATYEVDRRLLVMYSLGEGVHTFIRADERDYGVASQYVTNQDLLLVLYEKEDETWTESLAVYTQQMWPDSIGEEVGQVAFGEEGGLEVHFVRNWSIEEVQTTLVERKMAKVVLSEGHQVRVMFFNEPEGQIYSKDPAGGMYFTDHTVWWASGGSGSVNNSEPTGRIDHGDVSGNTGEETRQTRREILASELLDSGIALRDFEYYREYINGEFVVSGAEAK